MAYFRKGVPAGWTWRDGRPRWIPSPTLRKAGWKGRDLKDGPKWLTKGASIDAAAAIVAAVEAWRAGRPIPAELANSAPQGAAQGGVAPAAIADRRSIGKLMDDYVASRQFRELAPATQMDRRSKLSRLVDVAAGYVEKPSRAALTKAAYDTAFKRYQERRAIVRSWSVDIFEPPPFGTSEDADDAHGLLHSYYWTLHDQVGVSQAHGVLAIVSTWLAWCMKIRAIRVNWAEMVDRNTPPGRIRVGTWEELRALIAAAEAMGYASIADSIILGVDLSWSQADRLSLKWAQIDAAGIVAGTRQKTGRKGGTPLLPSLGKRRVEAIKTRQAALYGDKLPRPTHVILCEDTGKPWSARMYRHRFREVREAAARDCPSVADFRDQDLRDTAVTVAYDAECNLPEIASRTLHSLRRITDVLDKHYGDIRREVATRGAGKLNDYLEEKGITL